MACPSVLRRLSHNVGARRCPCFFVSCVFFLIAVSPATTATTANGCSPRGKSLRRSSRERYLPLPALASRELFFMKTIEKPGEDEEWLTLVRRVFRLRQRKGSFPGGLNQNGIWCHVGFKKQRRRCGNNAERWLEKQLIAGFELNARYSPPRIVRSGLMGVPIRKKGVVKTS